jgi:PAS domain S-box-containing protein
MSRILILEDERVVARDIQNLLTKIGYETSMAASGEEAIRVARRDTPDLALVDIRLGGALDGIETAQVLREELDLSVVYLTAHSDGHTLERAKATEPCGYLVKPFDKTTLQTTLEIATHKSTVERRRRVEQRWQTAVLDQLMVGLIVTDAAGKVTKINACGQALTGWSEQEALGQAATEVLALHGEDKASLTADVVEAALRGKECHSASERADLVSKSGSETAVEHQASSLRDNSQQIVGASLVFWPSGTAAPQLIKHASCPSDGDPVTGLPGREHATAKIQALQGRGTNLYAALFLLDHYYVIARKYGIRTANELLTYYGTILAQYLPDCEGLYRWTGPSFVALIGPVECKQGAERSISRCTGLRMGGLFQPSSASVWLTLSGSAQVFQVDDVPADVLIVQIDSRVAIQMRSQQY